MIPKLIAVANVRLAMCCALLLSLLAAMLWTAPVHAQAGGGRIESIVVTGNQRIEPATLVSYLTVQVGDPFDPAALDESLKRLFATGLFSDVSFNRRGNTLIIEVVENPIINRIVFEGNDTLDNEELSEEVQLRPRIVFTRAKVRADGERMRNR